MAEQLVSTFVSNTSMFHNQMFNEPGRQKFNMFGINTITFNPLQLKDPEKSIKIGIIGGVHGDEPVSVIIAKKIYDYFTSDAYTDKKPTSSSKEAYYEEMSHPESGMREYVKTHLNEEKGDVVYPVKYSSFDHISEILILPCANKNGLLTNSENWVDLSNKNLNRDNGNKEYISLEESRKAIEKIVDSCDIIFDLHCSKIIAPCVLIDPDQNLGDIICNWCDDIGINCCVKDNGDIYTIKMYAARMHKLAITFECSGLGIDFHNDEYIQSITENLILKMIKQTKELWSRYTHEKSFYDPEKDRSNHLLGIKAYDTTPSVSNIKKHEIIPVVFTATGIFVPILDGGTKITSSEYLGYIYTNKGRVPVSTPPGFKGGYVLLTQGVVYVRAYDGVGIYLIQKEDDKTKAISEETSEEE